MNIKLGGDALYLLGAAYSSAKELGHSFIGSGHILLALLIPPSIGDSNESAALRALTREGLSPEKVKTALLRENGNGDPGLDPGGMTVECETLLRLSGGEALRLGFSTVCNEHILLALLRDGKNIACKIIKANGVEPQSVARAVFDFMNASASSHSSPSGDSTRLAKPPAKPKVKRADISEMLLKYGRNLSEAAALGKLPPLIGRKKEIERVMRILARKNKNNPCLVGAPGVGKTAVVEGIARLLADGNLPESLEGKQLISIDLASVIAGTKYRGEFEERIRNIINEVIKCDNVILFIDELHTLVGAGGADGAIDAANILKPYLARGELRLIGATTYAEYRKYIEKDAALERRFSPVVIEEPRESETLEILRGIKKSFEDYHGVVIDDEALSASVRLSERFIEDRRLPDKAIDLIDEASSRGSLRVAACKSGERVVVMASDIEDIVSERTGIPIPRLREADVPQLVELEALLRKRIVGQEKAVREVAWAIKRARAGLRDEAKPIGSFIFTGPGGVGKTELCKALAEALFGNEKALIRFDMNEYSDKSSAARLIGSPPGYVGYDEGGQLTEKVRLKPYSVILFDEVEKAAPEIFSTLLSMLDEGYISDSHGRRTSFRNTVIIMTSNLKTGGTRLGFGSGSLPQGGLTDFFKPEFLARFDGIIAFSPLSQEQKHLIAEKMLTKTAEKARSAGVEFEWSSETSSFIASFSSGASEGARKIARVITSEIEDRISEEMIAGHLKKGGKISVTPENGTLLFTISNSSPLDSAS